MKRMSLKFIAILTLLFMTVTSVCIVANASAIVPYADTEFASATTNLTSKKNADFDATLYEYKSAIKVTACVLQKEVNSKWEKVTDLTVPSYVAKNTNCYAASMNYSSSIGKGKYRIVTTWDADGHSITRNSNARTFN